MPTWAAVENIITIVACVALVRGGYALGAGGWSWLGLLLLLNINYVKTKQ